MGKDEAGSINRVNYRRHDIFCMYWRQPPTTWQYYPRQIAGTNLPTPRGWVAWLARARVYVHNLLRVLT